MSTAQAAGKGLWMSEVDGTWKAGTDPYMYAGLGLASRIMTDINGMMPTAWVMWDIIDIHKDSTFSGEENNDFPTTSGFWGVGVADHDKQEIRVSKKYYAYGQFTRYINPGSTIILSSDTTNHLCAYDKHNGRIVIVASNTTANTQKMKYDLNQFVNVGSKVKVIRTSSSENWAQLDDLSTSMKAFSAELAPNSITTFIVEPDTTNKELTLKNRNGYSLNGITITDAGNGNVFLKKGDKYVAVNSDKSISFADTGSRFTMENYNGYYKFKDATTGEYLNVDNRQLLKTGQNFMPPTAPEGSAVFVATYDKSGILTDVKVNPSSPLDIAQNMRCFVWKNDTLSPAAKSEVIEDTSSSLWDVQISSEVSSISISADKSFVYAGNTVNMTCSLLPNTANQSVTWSVKGEDGISETSIASIDPQTGVLATTNAGVVTVIARSNVYDGIYSLYKVTIYGNNTYFTISNKNSGLILQPLNRSSSEGTSYVQWQNLGYATQQFQLKDAGDGFYYIVNRYNGMAILANSSTSTLTQTASYTDNDLAKWSFTIVSGQYGKILNKQTGKAIDVSGQSTVNGGSIIQYAYSGGNNQLWSFSEFVGEPTRTLSVTADNTQVSIGSTLQMNAVFEPDNCETSVQWSVSDTAIAEISDSGLLTGKSSGTVTVTATSTVYAGVSGSIDITVLNAGTSIIKAWTNNFDALDLNGFVCSGTATIATNNNSTPALFVQNKLNNTSSGTGSGTASNTLASALTCGENQYVDIQFDMYCSNSGGTASFQLYSGTTPVINMSTDSWTTNLTLTLGSTAVNTSSVNIGKLLRNSTNTGSSAYNVSNGAHFHIQIDFAKHTIKLNAYNNTSTSTVLSCEGTLPEEITSLDKMVFSANYTSWTKYMIVDNLSTYILSNS
ncbi:MAG: RICIN domain-containing protein, partial [Clostridia bacterium]|nr:RICIN domain-containing protein [Clostridia bacterium]